MATQHHEAHDEGTLSLEENVVIRKTGADGSEGFRTSRSGDDPRQSGSDSTADGQLSDTVAGIASPKAARELRTATGLVDSFNRALEPAHRWQPPELWIHAEQGVDCVATRTGAVLKIQITTPESDAWRHNAQHKEDFTRSEGEAGAVADIKDAIEKKELKAHPDITLALDAIDSPRYAHKSVIDLFRTEHGQWAQSLKFNEIWIVGPAIETVYRLDTTNE